MNSTLTRRTPLKRREPISKKHRKTKGQRGEREIVEMSKRVWPSIRRNFGSGSQGGSDFTGTPGYALEGKWQEKCTIWPWIEQCHEAASPTETPVVVFRRSRSRWYACLPYEDFLALVEASQL